MKSQVVICSFREKHRILKLESRERDLGFEPVGGRRRGMWIFDSVQELNPDGSEMENFLYHVHDIIISL